ncbi:hypothetical protein NIES2119_09970 [[Phormidium ambiguum] IAM M-71]|uniref:Uncharacterized protein n=1 Tax=[Phormidium ambiguum] IAM M-71 TaxID=454136 RepID=A0A1U7IME2_9CYAN|nr:hypothetical protein [Phormidium ambiguum]OKH38354.1 hypothetical protein NIES2119_09970 [Phormidium ambiguum IAM M-71]
MALPNPFDGFFSPLKIKPSELRSRELRKFSTSGTVAGIIKIPVSDGIRRINADQVDAGQGGLIQQGVSFIQRWIVNPIKKYGGFLFTAVSKLFPRTFSEWWSTLVQLTAKVVTFDWAQTDAAIEQRIKRNNQTIVEGAAGALGAALGWGVVRVATLAAGRLFGAAGAGKKLDIKVPVVTGRVAAAVAEEGGEEIRGRLYQLLTQFRNAQLDNAFLGFVLTARKHEWFGMESVKIAGANASFAKKIEDAKEKLPKDWQQPVENFLEEFGEAILEGGYIAASEFDSQWALARQAAKDAKGPQRTIILKPDRNADKDTYIITGPQEFVQEETERILHEEQLMAKKDIGVIIGGELEDVLRKSPAQRQLKIRWNTQAKDGPPLTDQRGIPGKFAECNIPYVKQGLSWNDVKAAADEFMRGNPYWRTIWKCFIQDRYLGNLTITGASEAECERRMKKLIRLMPSNVDFRGQTPTKLSASASKKEEAPERFYAWDCTLTVHQNAAEDGERWERKGRYKMANPDAKWFERNMKVDLWMTRKPEGFTGFN